MHNDQLIAQEFQIDFREVFKVLIGGKNLIVGLSAFFATSSLIIALILPNQYKSVAVLAPAHDSSGGIPAAFSQISGLASFAGVKIGAGSLSEAQIAHEIMNSWGFIETFIKESNLEVAIYASKGWDREKNSLIIDDDLYDIASQKWLIETDDGTRDPTSWELYEKFSENISVFSDSDSGLVSVSVVNYSPFVAKEQVDLFVAAINRHMQQRKMAMINNSIEYLQEEIEKSSIAGMRQVLYTIIEEQIKSKMLSQATPEHTFVIVNPSMVPEEPSEPSRLLIIFLGTLLGLIISVLLVFIKNYQVGPKSKLLN